MSLGMRWTTGMLLLLLLLLLLEERGEFLGSLRLLLGMFLLLGVDLVAVFAYCTRCKHKNIDFER